MFLGSIDGQDVATSMAVVTGGLVGVYNVQVRPDFRSRGLGRAMTQAALAAGSRHGCTAATLQSTEMGLPVYERMGFTTQYKIVRYVRPGSDE
jgi:GNAT superfamily N-acetyltransferase